MRKQVLLSWSGGKDSALALRTDPKIEVAGLLTSVTRDRAYRERLLGSTGFEPIFPIWGLDTAELARRFVRDGFAARIVCVDTTQLDGAFAHRVFDLSLLADLPPGVDPCGERGEFHTFVSDGPGYDGPVEYTVGETVFREERFAYGDLIPPTRPEPSAGPPIAPSR